MPELPEVETMCRGIAPLVGKEVVGVETVRGPRRPILISPGPAAMRRRLVGSTVRRIGRAGKRVVVWFSSEDEDCDDVQAERTDRGALVLEPRMTGLVLLANPPTQEHLRFHLKLSRRGSSHGEATQDGLGEDLWFWDRRGLGSVRLMSRRQYDAAFGPDVLGPDALEITPEHLRARLGKSRRAVKVALLDQRVVAGIGNLYAAEILHVAGLSPLAACDRLRKPQWEAICTAIQAVLREAIHYEGSTLGDGTYRNALNQQGEYQNHHRVYGRAGVCCENCHSGVIRRIVQAQRATFYCPICQRTGSRGAAK